MNALPQIATEIERIKGELLKEPTAAILPIQRKQLLSMILANPNGARVRKELVLLTAEHVIDIYTEKFPHFTLVNDALRFCRKYVDSPPGVYELQACEQLLLYWLDLLALPHPREAYPALFAAHAVYCTVSLLNGYDPWFDLSLNIPINFTKSLTDEYLEDYQSDTAKWASFSYAGKVGDPEFKKSKRMEFWLWWLTIAIPKAYKFTHNS